MCRLFLMTIALLAILFGISGLYMMPKLIQQKIEQKLQLKIGTKNYERFTKVPIPLTVKFYFFNITNSDKVLQGLERPQFNEVGPFMYKQWRRRDVVDILDNNRKIVYKEYKTFYSMWPTSGNEYLTNSISDNDNNNKMMKQTHANTIMLNPNMYNVTIVNLPLLSVLTKLAQLDDHSSSSLKRSIASKVLSRLINEGNEQILVTKPVNELLFDGYKVGLMDAANDLISNTLGYNFESPLPRNKFGFFYGKNGTWNRREAGEMTVWTGRNESMKDFMLVDNWNGLKVLNVWHKNTEAGNRCNEISGTDGSQFHPGVTREQVLSIFSPMICTSIFVKYKEDTSTRDIPLLRFTTPPDVFAAPKKSARNACYCTIQTTTAAPVQQEEIAKQHQRLNLQQHSSTSWRNASKATSSTSGKSKFGRITDGRCYLDGLMDLSLCQRGAPVAASSPHFYNADPMLAMASGLQPRKELHETYLDIEPMTGAVFRAASRAQLNAFVEQAALDVVDSRLIGHMTPMIAPLMWLEEAAEIDEKSSGEFKSQLLNLVQKAKRSFYIGIVFGIVLGFCVAIQCWYVTCYKVGAVDSSSTKKHERKLRQLDSDADSERARRRRQRQRQAAAARRNRLPVEGARRSNLAANMTQVASEHQQQQQPVKVKTHEADSLLVAAVALGAADAAPTNNQRRNNHKRAQQRRAAHDDDDEDAFSRRALVANEWSPGATSRATAASGDSSHEGAPSETPSLMNASIELDSHAGDEQNNIDNE